MTDWKPGDLALCKNGKPWKRYLRGQSTGQNVPGPRKGQTLVVQEVNTSAFTDGLCLNFAEFRPTPNWKGYNEKHFIKVTPEEEDEFDKEIINLYKGQKIEENV